MAGKNTKTAAEAAAQGGASAHPAGTPGTEQQSQDSTNTDQSQQGGDGDEGEQPDYQAKYAEAQAQVQQLTTELQAVTTQRDEAQYALGEEVRVHAQCRQMRDSISQDFYEYRLAHGEPPADTRPMTATGPEGTSAASSEQPTGEAPAYDEEAIRDLLKRMGLKQAWIAPDGQPAFDEAYLRRFHGDEVVDSLTVISAE